MYSQNKTLINSCICQIDVFLWFCFYQMVTTILLQNILFILFFYYSFIEIPMSTLISVACFLFLLSVSGSNLICNGDFETYSLGSAIFIDSISERYSFISNNQSCWYSPNSRSINVIKTNYGTGTNSMKLSILIGTKNIKACQKVTLIPGKRYFLTYDFTIFPGVTQAFSYTFINNLLINTIQSTQFNKILKVYKQFEATVSVNQICFNGSVSIKPGLNSNFYSPILDNFVLDVLLPKTVNQTVNQTLNQTNSIINSTVIHQIIVNYTNLTDLAGFENYTNQTIPQNDSLPISQYELAQIVVTLQFILVVDEIQGVIIGNSTFFPDESLFKDIQANTKVYIQGQLQKSVYFDQNSQGFLSLSIICQRTYNIVQIAATMPPLIYPLLKRKLKIEFIFNGRQFFIIVLPQQMITSIKQTQQIAESALTIIIKSYNYLKSFMLSYFVANIMNFLTLSLLYNFLNIRSQPNFSHIFLEKLIQITYLQNSFIDTVKKVFQNNELQLLPNSDDFVIFPERVKNFVNNYAWFGKFGITYNYLSNNKQTIFLIFFNGTKYFALFLFFKLAKNLSCFQIKIKYLKNFLTQIFVMTPMITISATVSLQNFGYLIPNQKLNQFLHIITLLIVILIPFKLFSSKKKAKKGQKKNMKNMYKFTKNTLVITIPILTALQTKLGFFLILSMQFICLIATLKKSFKDLKMKQKVFTCLQLAILMIHHLAFSLMYFLEVNKYGGSWVPEVLTYCGLIVIFTVIVGCCLDILDFAITFLQSIFKVIKKAKIWCLRRYETNKEQREKQETTLKLKVNKKNFRLKQAKLGIKSCKELTSLEEKQIYIPVEKMERNSSDFNHESNIGEMWRNYMSNQSSYKFVGKSKQSKTSEEKNRKGKKKQKKNI